MVRVRQVVVMVMVRVRQVVVMVMVRVRGYGLG